MGPVDFGLFAVTLAIAQFAALIWPTTLGAAASKFVASEPSLAGRRKIISHLSRRSSGGALIAAAVAAGLWYVLEGQHISGAIVCGLVCLAYSKYHFTRGVLFGSRNFIRSTSQEVLLAITCLAGVLLVHETIDTASAYAATLGVGLTAYAIAIGRVKATPTSLSPSVKRDIRNYVFVGTVGTLASAGFLQLSILAAAHWGGHAGAGQYGAALALATPASIFAASLGSALLPSLSAAGSLDDRSALNKLTDRATRGINLLAIPLFGTLIISAAPMTRIVWGSAFAPSSDILQVLLLAVMVTSCSVPCVTRLSATSVGSLATATKVSLIAVLGAVALWVPLGQSHGALGIAWGYLLGALATSATLFAICWKRDGQAWSGLAVRSLLAIGILAALPSTVGELGIAESAAAAAVFRRRLRPHFAI